jgi:cation transport ATPase
MRKKPEALDYEGVFPPKLSRPRENAAPESPIEPDLVLSPSGAAALPSRIATSAPAAQFPAEAPGKEKKPKPRFMEVEAGMWTARRGHGVTFALLFLFSIVLYFRPYELIPALSSLKSMAFYVGITTLVVYFITQIVSEGNLTVRPREVNMVLLVGLAAILSIPFAIDSGEAWEEFYNLAIKTILIFIGQHLSECECDPRLPGRHLQDRRR